MSNARAERIQPTDVAESGINMTYTGARISGRDVGCYTSVYGDVNVNQQTSEKRTISIDIARWLRKPSIDYKSIQEETRVMRTPNTIRWFFESKEYILWAEDDAGLNQNLQCIGMPGAGKTVLASAIIEDLERRFREESSSKPRVVLYTYFKHDRQAIQTKPVVLANLLSQLIQGKEPPSDSAMKLYQEYEKHLDVTPGHDKIMSTLRSEISANSTTYIVVDALDEFAPKDFASALALISDLEELNIKLLITSRYDIQFTHDSQKVQVAANEADIHTFIEEQISSSPGHRLKNFLTRSPELKSVILREVTSRSQGMFLIARFLMSWICQQLRLSDVKNALKSLPSGTDAMYKLTMARVEDQSDTLKRLGMSALSWVLLAKRRLRMKELQHVVAFELRGGDEMANDDDLYEMEDIISSCMGLITCVDDEVQFVHFSTQEFLANHCDGYFPDARLRVMETCLRYLIVLAPLVPDDLRYAEDTYGNATQYFRPFPFASYASSRWGLHTYDVDDHEHLNVDLVDRFFSHPLSPYLASNDFPSPRITQTEEMSTVVYKTLFFSVFGLCSLLKRLIEKANASGGDSTQVDLDVRDKRGWTPLFFATVHNRSAAAQLLLNAGADATVADEDNITYLHEAASRGFLDIITVLLQHKADIDSRDDRGESAIFVAVWENKLEAIELLNEKGADISIPNASGKTLLHQAAHHGLLDIATILLEKGMEIDSLDDDRRSPIWMAVDAGEWEMVRLLTEKGADISKSNKSGQTLLHRAAYWGKSDIAAILLVKGAEINLIDEDGCTPIWTAVNGREREMVRWFIEKGADISIPNASGKTLLHQAAHHGLLDIATILLEKGMEIDSLDDDRRSPIWMAVDAGEWEMVSLLVGKGADIGIPNKRGQTVLHRAAYNGLLDVVTILLEKGMEINSLDGDGRSPVWIAVDGQENEMVRLLIEKGADVSIQGKNGQTLLHRAAYQGLSDIVTILLDDHRFDVSQQDDEGHTAIFLAAEGGQPDIIHLLLAEGAEASLTNHNGEAALHGAARKNRADAVIALMLDPGVDIDAKDISGRTALLTAMEHESYFAVEALLKNGASTADSAEQNLSSEELDDLLRWSAYHGCTRTLELLIAMGANLGGTDDDGDGVVAYAALGPALKSLKFLLSQGIVDMDKPNCLQQAPISYVIKPWHTREDVPDSDRAAFARILLDRGADIHRKDVWGNNTPLTLARKCEWPEIRDLVEQHAVRLPRGEADIEDERVVVDEVDSDRQNEQPASPLWHDQDDTGDSSIDEGDLDGALVDGDNQRAMETKQVPEGATGEIAGRDPDDAGGRMADGRANLAVDDTQSGRNERKRVERVASRAGEGLQEAKDAVDDEERHTKAHISLREAASGRRERAFTAERMLIVILIVIIARLVYIVGLSTEKA